MCGQKFVLPQELSRHIRDKVCKSDEENFTTESVDHHADGLSTISLLELPIITELPHDVEVSEIIVTEKDKNEPSTSAITEHGYSMSENATKEENATSYTEGEHQKSIDTPTLWGCKQCDFR